MRIDLVPDGAEHNINCRLIEIPSNVEGWSNSGEDIECMTFNTGDNKTDLSIACLGETWEMGCTTESMDRGYDYDTVTLVILTILLLILPILMGIYYSLTDWTGIGTNFNFIGLDNYVKVFTNDKRFGNALIFNLRYSVFLVAGIVVIGFLLAMLLNREMKGRSFFRTLYFMPAVLSMITIALVFKQVYFYVLPGIGKAIGSATLSENIIADRKLAIYGILFVQWLPLAVIVMAFIANLLPVPLDIILSDFTCVMCIVAFLIETGQLMLGQTFLGTIGTEKPMLDAVVFVIALFSILCSRTVRDER